MSSLWLDANPDQDASAPQSFSIVLIHNGRFPKERAQRFLHVLTEEFNEVLTFDVASWSFDSLCAPKSNPVPLQTAIEADLVLLSFDSVFWRVAHPELEVWLHRIHQTNGTLHNVIGITDEHGVDFSIPLRAEFQPLAPHSRLVYLPAVLSCPPSAFVHHDHHWPGRDNHPLSATLAGLVEHSEPHRHGGINE